MDTRQGLQSALVDLEGQAKSYYEDTKKKVQEHGHQAIEKSRRGIGNRPFTAIAVAFACGAALGSFCRRAHR